MEKTLTDREESVLSLIVQDYVAQAEPSGSRIISKKGGLLLSPATIRNVISDLEEKGLVTQPHTSAGRIPTDKGYRYYVDNLIKLFALTDQEKEGIERKIEVLSGSFDEVASLASKVLSSVSSELGVILSPRFRQGVFKRLTIAEIAEKRVMLILTIESGLINSLMVEAETRLGAGELQAAAEFINERLSGRKLAEIEKNLAEMVFTDDSRTIGIVRIFTENAADLFSFPDSRSLFADGARELLLQPEFTDQRKVEAIVEFLENKKMLIHVLDQRELKDGVLVTIGAENEAGQFKSYSIVTSNYNIREDKGTLGVIGPTRMPYPKLISVVDYTAKMLSRKLSNMEK